MPLPFGGGLIGKLYAEAEERKQRSSGISGYKQIWVSEFIYRFLGANEFEPLPQVDCRMRAGQFVEVGEVEQVLHEPHVLILASCTRGGAGIAATLMAEWSSPGVALY